MSDLDLLMEEWNRINDEVIIQRNERERFRGDKATEMALQQRIATLQTWMDNKGYNIQIADAVENQFNEWEFVHQDTIKNLEDSIEALSTLPQPSRMPSMRRTSPVMGLARSRSDRQLSFMGRPPEGSHAIRSHASYPCSGHWGRAFAAGTDLRADLWVSRSDGTCAEWPHIAPSDATPSGLRIA